jgi:hypothetical protein
MIDLLSVRFFFSFMTALLHGQAIARAHRKQRVVPKKEQCEGTHRAC